MGSGCRCESGGSLFHLKVRWGEDSIFNASAGIGGEPRPAGGIEGVHRFHQPDGADGNEVVLIGGEGVVLFDNVGHQPQVVTDEFFPCSRVARLQRRKGRKLFPGGQGPWEAPGFQMKRQNQKLCGKKLQQRQ